MTVAQVLQSLSPAPAVISEATARSPRRRGIFLSLWLCVWLGYGALVLFSATRYTPPRVVVTHAVVRSVYPPNTIEPLNLPYGIRASDGDYSYFKDDPRLVPRSRIANGRTPDPAASRGRTGSRSRPPTES